MTGGRWRWEFVGKPPIAFTTVAAITFAHFMAWFIALSRVRATCSSVAGAGLQAVEFKGSVACYVDSRLATWLNWGLAIGGFGLLAAFAVAFAYRKRLRRVSP